MILFGGAYETDAAIATTREVDKPPSVFYQSSYTKYHDLLHTKLEVSFDWSQQYLYGIVTLHLKPHYYPQQQLVLDAQNFIIHGVFLIENQAKEPLVYAYDKKKLVIELGRDYTKEESYQIEINYIAKPHEAPQNASTIRSVNQGLYFMNPNSTDPEKPRQIWTTPYTSSCWFPTIDLPNQRCTQEIYITVEDKFRTLSNGMLVYAILNEDHTRTDYWRMDLPHAPYLFMLVVGEFAEIQDEWNEIPVNYYVEPAYEVHAKAIFGNTPEIIAFFSEKLDFPYPWSKYSQVIVRDYIGEAMENTTATIFSDILQLDDRVLIERDHDDLIAHQLFHHWFGNLVTGESWAYLPLNKSFAYLGAHLWRAYKQGDYARDLSIWNTQRSYLREVKYNQSSVIRPTYTDSSALFDSCSYHKGALVLHMLQHYLGEEAFLQSISHYLKKHAFSTADIHQLRKAFEEISGLDLQCFFNQWFLVPGYPQLYVEHQYASGKLTLKIWQKQQTPAHPYQLPIAVDIWAQGSKKRHWVTVDKAYNEFTWLLGQQPELVYIDRKCLLAGELEHPKTTQEYQNLYYYGEDFFSKHEALSYLICRDHISKHDPIWHAVLQDDYWFFRKMALDALEVYQGQDLDNLEDTLVKLSQNDKHVAVRAAAIRILGASSQAHKYTHLYKANLYDTSYHLASTALLAYATSGKDDDKSEILVKFETSDNIDIIIALAHYYTNIKQVEKYKWFRNKIANLHTSPGFEKLIPLFARYITILLDKKKQEDALMLMQAIAGKSTKNQLRLSIYHVLAQMPQKKIIKKIMNQIKTTQ